MNWALKGLAGPLKDKTYPLESGMSLGRQGDVVIPDTKSSSIHARIQVSPAGEWTLEDNNSKNGTRIAGERVTAVPLSVGLVFYIGDQGFEIVDLVAETSAPPAASEYASESEAEAPPPVKTQRYWYDVLAKFLAKNAESFTDGKKPLSPLNPALVLDFVRGLQMNSHWTIGYGPRKLGSASMDLPLLEPGAPAVSFEILPSSEGIVFKTAHPEIVLLNGQSVDSQVLRVGDTIRVHETLIEVDFTE